MVGVARHDRVVLERAEPLGELDVLGAGDVLVAEEQHLVRQQQRLQLGEQLVAAGDLAEVDARDSAPIEAVSLVDVHGRHRPWQRSTACGTSNLV